MPNQTAGNLSEPHIYIISDPYTTFWPEIHVQRKKFLKFFRNILGGRVIFWAQNIRGYNFGEKFYQKILILINLKRCILKLVVMLI